MAEGANVEGATFSFVEELEKYCKNDVLILITAACKFVKETFNYQQELVTLFGRPKEWDVGFGLGRWRREDHNYSKKNTLLRLSDRLIFPYSMAIPTSGALFFKILKQYSIPRNTFYVSPDPYGKHSALSSLVEREFFHCMRQLGPQTGVVGADKWVRTQVRFKRQTVDGYVEETGTCFNFHGCEEHVHRGCEVRGKGNSLEL